MRYCSVYISLGHRIIILILSIPKRMSLFFTSVLCAQAYWDTLLFNLLSILRSFKGLWKWACLYVSVEFFGKSQHTDHCFMWSFRCFLHILRLFIMSLTVSQSRNFCCPAADGNLWLTHHDNETHTHTLGHTNTRSLYAVEVLLSCPAGQV